MKDTVKVIGGICIVTAVICGLIGIWTAETTVLGKVFCTSIRKMNVTSMNY